jgi:hypothetical protein
MLGAISPFPHTPSRLGALLKKAQRQLYVFILYALWTDEVIVREYGDDEGRNVNGYEANPYQIPSCTRVESMTLSYSLPHST